MKEQKFVDEAKKKKEAKADLYKIVGIYVVENVQHSLGGNKM